jgi:tRNA (adenine37-N6)-methyltransferase
MSCVKLEKVDGLKIYISESDILNGSPVIDIKPYLPYSDSFPNAATGWVKKDFESIYKITFKLKARRQCEWLKENAKINLDNFAKLQLEFYPTDNSRKRITILENEGFVLAYRTWRILYAVNSDNRTVTINEIRSGYSDAELHNEKENKYQDKLLHQLFRKRFKPAS